MLLRGPGRAFDLRLCPVTNSRLSSVTPRSESRFDTQDGLYDLAWSELHENQIATGSGDGSVKLWDIALNVRTKPRVLRETCPGSRPCSTGLSHPQMARAPARGLQRRLEQHDEGAVLHEQLGRLHQNCGSNWQPLAEIAVAPNFLRSSPSRSGLRNGPPRCRRSRPTALASILRSSPPLNPPSSAPAPPTAPSNSGTRARLSLRLQHPAAPPPRAVSRTSPPRS